MEDKKIFEGIVSAEKQAEYEKWLFEHLGPDLEEEILASKARVPTSYFTQAMPELQAIEQDIADAMNQGIPAHSKQLDEVLMRHNRWIAGAWGRDCSPEAYSGLADVYQHPDFRSRYEAISPGLTDYLSDAMKSWSMRQPT